MTEIREMHDDTRIRILADGPSRLEKGLDDRRREIEDLEMRLCESHDEADRARLQDQLDLVRAEYAPSLGARIRSLF